MSVPTSTKTWDPSSTRARTAQTQRWSIILLLFLASTINYVDRVTLSFALPSISQSLGLDALAKGVVLSAFFWSYALMQIPVGLLADRTNLRWLYAGAFILWSLAQGFTGLAAGLGVLIAFRILLGIGESIYLPGGTKIVSVLFASSERGLPCGIFDAGTRVGMLLGGLLIPILLARYGWRATFAGVGFSALVWLIPWLLITPRQLRAPRPEAPSAAVAAPQPCAPRRSRDLFGICLGFFCFDYYWYLLVTWLPDYLVTVRHLKIVSAGLYTVGPYLVFGVSQVVGGWVGDRLVRAGWNETRVRKGIVTVAFLTGLLLIPAALASDANRAIFFVMGGCLVGLSNANQLVILQGCAPPEQIGLWTGVYNFVGNIGGILAPILTGLLIQTTGSYTPAFVLAAVLIGCGQLSYWFLVGPVERREG